jgi:hypothetical protein
MRACFQLLCMQELALAILFVVSVPPGRSYRFFACWSTLSPTWRQWTQGGEIQAFIRSVDFRIDARDGHVQ